MDQLVALQLCDQFVGRTTNWLYDHLRNLPRYRPVVLCDRLTNRSEFPLLEAREKNAETVARRIWRRFRGDHLYPADGRWLRKLAPTVLHSHFGYVAVHDLPLRNAVDAPWLIGFYGADVYELGRSPSWQATYGRLFSQADRILALGPVMANALAELGCPSEKLVVHPLGVDVAAIPWRRRERRPSDPLEVLYAGTFREKKGVEYLIKGAALARKRGVRLRLTLVGDAIGKAGDQETKDAIFREIATHRMASVVTHQTYMPFEQLMQLARRSHVFVAPSVTSASGDAEGTPFVLQQMMATGMPVIATRHSDIPFLFGPLADRLVPERDHAAIADRLEWLASDTDRLGDEGLLLRTRIQTAFDVRDRAAALRSIYDSLTL